MPLWQPVAGALLNLVAASTTVPFYLELDGAYYSVPGGGTIEYIGDAWVVTETSMTNCNRRNGQLQQFSDFALFYGPNLDVVYLSLAGGSSYTCLGTTADEACVLSMVSTTGDIECSGAVSAPDPIFADGFDGP
jgi:hypothetical protein